MTALDAANAAAIAVFGSGGLGVLIKWMLDRRKPKIDRTQILSTASSENVSAALAIAAEARAIASEANSRSTLLEGELRRVKSALYSLQEWAYYVVRNWDEVRQHHKPPELPPEIHHKP